MHPLIISLLSLNDLGKDADGNKIDPTIFLEGMKLTRSCSGKWELGLVIHSASGIFGLDCLGDELSNEEVIMP